MRAVHTYLLKVLALALGICSVCSEGIKLTAIRAVKLSNRLRQPAIYDGVDSIYLLSYVYEKSDTDYSIFSQTDNSTFFLKYDLLTSNITAVDPIYYDFSPNAVEMDRVGNFFYFDGDKNKIHILNSTITKIESVLSLNDWPFSSVSSKFNDSQVVLFRGCNAASFDMNTHEVRLLPGMNMCPYDIKTFCTWKNKITIVKNSGEVLNLDLNTFPFKLVLVSKTLFQNFSNFHGMCGDKYIYSIGNYKKGLYAVLNASYAMSVLNMETYESRQFEVDKLPYGKKPTSFNPPFGVFVKKLYRIYFFGGSSFGDRHGFENYNYKGNGIWYIELEPIIPNENLGTRIQDEKFEFSTVVWIWSASILVLILLIFGLIVVLDIYTIHFIQENIPKHQISRTNIKPNIIVWKSDQSCRPIPDEVLGSGAFAKVYKAEDTSNTGLFYAVKKIVLYKALIHMRTWDVNKVFREIYNLMEIENENVVKLYNFWFEDDFGKAVSQDQLVNLKLHEWSTTHDYSLYLKMELCDYTLQHWLTIHPTMDYREGHEIKKMMSQIVNGLRGIHEKRIIHRDIKPNNILYCKNEDLWKIGDLGLSTKVRDVTSDHTIIGCKSYKSPEMDSGVYDIKTDVFSLGLTFLEIIHVFSDQFQRIRQFDKIRKDATFINMMINPVLFPELVKLISRMLVTDPVTRINISDKLFDDFLTQRSEKKLLVTKIWEIPHPTAVKIITKLN